MTDTTFSGGEGDFVRPGDTDDFYGVVDGLAPVTLGGTTATGVDTGPGIGDWILQSDIGNVLTSGDVMTTLSIATPDAFRGSATFSWTYDEAGTHEADDDLVMQIRDVSSGQILASKIIGDDVGAPLNDSIFVDATGRTSLEARILYDSGFNTGSQDGEEVQISAQVFSANAIDSSLEGTVVTSGWTGVVEDAGGNDFFGVLEAGMFGPGDSGTIGGNSFNGNGDHTNADGTDDSLGWAAGDFVLEGNDSSISFPAANTTLATMDLTIPDGATDIDLTLGFNVDREGTLEANDALRFEIVDLTDNSVLASLELADDADFPVGDTYTTLESLANEGLTDVQARLIFLGGFADGDAEEIQIGAPSFSAAFTLPVPEPASVAIWSLIGAGLAGFAYLGRRRKS